MSFSLEALAEDIARRAEDIANQRAQLDKLEEAYATLRDIYRSPNDTASASHATEAAPPSRDAGGADDLAGKTVREAIHIVLRESVEPLHPREVAEKAVARGYRGAKADPGNVTAIKTFADIMRKDKTLIDDGRRRFRLRTPDGSLFDTIRPEAKSARSAATVSGGKSRADAIEAVMRHKNRPLTVIEILDGLKEAKQSVPSQRRSAFNSVYGSLKHAADRFEKIDRGVWALKQPAQKPNDGPRRLSLVERMVADKEETP